MNATIETTSAGAVVLTGKLKISPNEAREFARKLIECAHACDKYNRRLKRQSTIDDTNDLDRHVAEHLVQ
jgi:hypothetical protein